MYLERIALTNFKNIEEATISFSPKINCICGSNGEGKTNLLDAIHYLSLTKSYFATGDSYTYRYGSSETAISGHYITDEGLSERIAIYMKRGGEKQVRRGKKNYTKFSEHIGLIPIVMVSPYDTSLINDSGEERRRFLNTILSQIDREYMHNLQCYNQLLVSRNKLLKEEFLNQELLETISAQMAPYAEYIHTKRLEICALLAKEAERFYAKLSNEKESVSLEYSSDMADIGFKEMMAQSIERDRALGYTVSGIQRDNFIFKLNGHRIKHCGS
ncbi:MAG: DNA replication and repair protein RecF, partial [Bacteroidales bacterium]|nr:DNA replication and repair protein RecF [Bacteroidales bacterium]